MTTRVDGYTPHEGNTTRKEDISGMYAPIPEYIIGTNDPTTASDGYAEHACATDYEDETNNEIFSEQAHAINQKDPKLQTKTPTIFGMGFIVGLIAAWIGFSLYLCLSGQAIGKIGENGFIDESQEQSSPYMNISPVDGIVETLNEMSEEDENAENDYEAQPESVHSQGDDESLRNTPADRSDSSVGLATSEQYAS